MLWKKEDVLEEEIRKGKMHLEKVFECRVNCFASPSNKCKRNLFKILNSQKLNYSGIIDRNLNRPINIKTIRNYIKRWKVRIIHKIPYPGIMEYKTHYEINACGVRNREYLEKIYSYCKVNNLDMVINTHYWELRDNVEIKNVLFNFIKDKVNEGAVPSTINDIIINKRIL